MDTSHGILPQSGGYLTSYGHHVRGSVTFSLDIPRLIQNPKLPPLGRSQARLRFPKGEFSEKQMRAVVGVLQTIVDEINAHRQKKPSGKHQIAAVTGPVAWEGPEKNLFGEWIVTLDRVGWGVDLREFALNRVIPSVIRCLCELSTDSREPMPPPKDELPLAATYEDGFKQALLF